MQMIAEIYGVLRDGLGMAPKEIGKVFGDWNKGRLNSYLIEITAAVLPPTIPRPEIPMVDMILDRAGQKGTGKWSVIEAQTLGVPATAIEAAVAARVLSSKRDERLVAEETYGKALTPPIGGDRAALLADLELALFAGKIAAYAQGFAVMDGASKEFGWNLPLPTIARIWRAGCITARSSSARWPKPSPPAMPSHNLLVAPAFVPMMKEAKPLAASHRGARGRGRLADAGAFLRARLFRQLSPGPRHIQPHPGAARLLRRAWLRAPGRAGSLPRVPGQRSGLTMIYAVLAYHAAGIVETWSAEEDAALMDDLHTVHRAPHRRGQAVGPAARLGPTARAFTLRGRGRGRRH